MSLRLSWRPQRLQIARTVMLQRGSESVFSKTVVFTRLDLNFKLLDLKTFTRCLKNILEDSLQNASKTPSNCSR